MISIHDFTIIEPFFATESLKYKSTSKSRKTL